MSFHQSRGLLAEPVITVRTGRLYRESVKRAIDVTLVLVAAPFVLLLLLPLMALISMDGASPIYAQKRVGRDGRIFRMLKLRTMVPNADRLLEEHLDSDPKLRAEWDEMQKLRDDPRITRVGRILRKTSMDELPQLWNVLAGDMSLVGPRPMMTSQRRLYPGFAYYAMRPGITGYWQISERNECSFAQRAMFDAAYFSDMSFAVDADILRRTLRVVMHATGH